MPFFSVVIPAYNRERLVARAIESVLSQDFDDYEVVVTDDASPDRTAEVVLEYAARDPRVRLVRHEVNRGVCPTRNTGVDAATAPWIVFLDSDDELAPGALRLMAERAKSVEPDVALLRFSCRWDDGAVSPYPPLTGELWDYTGFLRFLDRSARYSPETIMCVRRETFQTVRWPEDRSYEGGYHFAFAKRFKTRAYGEVARLYHMDAPNSSTFSSTPRFWLQRAPDMARAMAGVLENHGDALRQHAPDYHLTVARGAMKYSFLSGDRRTGLRWARQVLPREPLSLRSWAILLCGVIHPMLLARLDSATMRMRVPTMPVVASSSGSSESLGEHGQAPEEPRGTPRNPRT